MDAMQVEPTKKSKEAAEDAMDTVRLNESISETMAASRSSSNSDFSHNSSDPRRRRHGRETAIKIVSATYGPSDGRRLLTGEMSSAESARIPYTRDVTPFLRALLVIARKHDNDDAVNVNDNKETNETGSNKRAALRPSASSVPDDDESLHDKDLLVRMTTMAGGGVGGMRQNFITLMHGESMNTIFGDPCPGTSKKLKIHYVLYESNLQDVTSRAATSEVHRTSFAEHERVLLRRRVTFYQDDSKLKQAVAAAAKSKSSSAAKQSLAAHSIETEDEEATLLVARRMGRSQSISEFAEDTCSSRTASPLISPKTSSPRTGGKSDANGDGPSNTPSLCSEMLPPKPPRKWRLRSAVSEIVLPIILPLLEVRERVQCQLVCRVWRFVVKDWGVASRVDVNDDSFPNFTRPFLRGIMAHSYSSLHSLFLSDFHELKKDDLHPAIPHFKKLRTIDISRCTELDNSTMALLSQHVSQTLEVLYIKGLSKVTDEGLISVCHSCRKLQVLEISNIPITDESGVCIGENLTKLRALYMRDNYRLTNRSIDIITEKCTRLAQLTLWGCIRLRHLSFEQLDHGVGCGKLVLLNLWGCHSLLDDAAVSLGSMQNLRSLIVSECHRLTDVFLFGLAQKVPQLNHLYLRYCKRITDEGVNAVTNSMQNIYTLDLSFCSRISSAALVNLLEIRRDTLTELRLHNCNQLEIAMRQAQPQQRGAPVRANAGRAILGVLRSTSSSSCLNILDIRNCGGEIIEGGVPGDDPFTLGMAALHFDQSVPGFFSRPARWNSNVQKRLVDQMRIDDFTDDD